jgi:hypothetical protein
MRIRIKICLSDTEKQLAYGANRKDRDGDNRKAVMGIERWKNSPYSGQFDGSDAPKRESRSPCGSEPSLDELLAEPLIKLAMAADHIDAAVVYALFQEVRQKLDGMYRI